MTGFQTSFMSSVWNFCRWVADIPPYKTTLMARRNSCFHRLTKLLRKESKWQSAGNIIQKKFHQSVISSKIAKKFHEENCNNKRHGLDCHDTGSLTIIYRMYLRLNEKLPMQQDVTCAKCHSENRNSSAQKIGKK